MNTEPVHRTLDDDVVGVLVAGVRDGQRVLDDAADANWHTPIAGRLVRLSTGLLFTRASTRFVEEPSGSASDAKVAVSLISVPLVSGEATRTWNERITMAATGTSNFGQSTAPPDRLPPPLAEPATYAVFAGIASVRWTPVAAAVASAGLVTVNV